MTRGGVPRQAVPTLVELESCASTQDAVRALLDTSAAGVPVAVSARRQTAGRGRQGRAWADASGTQLLLSVGVAQPGSARLLEALPQRVIEGVHRVLTQQEPAAANALVWKAPNDLVARSDGAKVGGVLIDATTTGDRIDRVIVGIGVNLDGAPFQLKDGRAATSVNACCGGTELDHAGVVHLVAEHVAWLLLGATPVQP